VFINVDGATSWKKEAIEGSPAPGSDDTAIHDNVNGEINAVAEKAVPVGADMLLAEDSAVSFAKKKVAASNFLNGVDWDKTIEGFVPSNGTDTDHDIDISVGTAYTPTAFVAKLTSALGKQLDEAWAEGGTPGAPAGGNRVETVGSPVTPQTDTWYHLWVIRKDSDGTIDAMFDTSPTGANKPTGWTVMRRIGSVLTDGSSNIIGFSAMEIAGGGLHVLWNDPPHDVDVANNAAPQTPTMSIPPDYRVMVELNIRCQHPDLDRVLYASSPDIPAEGPSFATPPLGQIRTDKATSGQQDELTGTVLVRSNTSSQIRWESNGAGGSVDMATLGWTDPRR
jgi:hypothetical protein